MTKTETHLNELLIVGIDSLIIAEKIDAKVYSSYSSAALTPELNKALSPEQTNIKSHLQRLKMIKGILPDAKHITKQWAPFPLHKLKTSKRSQSADQDLQLILVSLQYQGVKIANYEMLHALAIATENEHAVPLLEQCLRENYDTSTWLKQILKNIVLPSLVSY